MAFDFNNLEDTQKDAIIDNTVSAVLMQSIVVSSVLHKHFDIRLTGFKDSKIVDDIFNCKPYIKENIGNILHATNRKNRNILRSNNWKYISTDTIYFLLNEYLGINKTRLLYLSDAYKDDYNWLKKNVPEFLSLLKSFMKKYKHNTIDDILISPDLGVAYMVFNPMSISIKDGFAIFVLTGKKCYDDCVDKIKMNKDDNKFEKFMRKVCKQYHVNIPTGVFKTIKIGDKDAIQYTSPIKVDPRGKIQITCTDPFHKGYNQIRYNWHELYYEAENDKDKIPDYILKHTDLPIRRCYSAAVYYWRTDMNIIFYRTYDIPNKIRYTTIICLDKSKYNEKTGELIK